MSDVKDKTARYRIEYDSKLLEEVVSQEISRLEAEGEMRIPDRFRTACDPIYDKYPIEDRNDIGFDEAFGDIYRSFFSLLGFEGLITSSLSEYPIIDEKVGEIVVKVCYAEEKEEANLAKRKVLVPALPAEGEDKEPEELAVISIAITSARFQDKEYLPAFLRHELMHVADMLDPEFCYDHTPLGVTPSEECIIKNHYGLIWDIYIDQRLIKNQDEDIRLKFKDKRREEFDSMYRSLPAEEKIAIFEGLWGVEKITHPQILACAKDPVKLLDFRASLTPEQIEKEKQEKKKKIHLPGMICPLCKFPTHKWIEEESIIKEVIEKVKEDAPTWDPSAGLCERCDEVYRSIVGKW